MKLTSALLLLASAPLLAQTTPPSIKPATATTVKKPATATTATHSTACAKLPEISSKVPALPPGSPCAKHLYTIVITPPVKLENVSPLEGPELRQTLKIEEPSSFSLDYIDIKAGTGPLVTPHKWYSVHYTGYLTDGTMFDASSKHPENDPFVVEIDHPHVIPGWYTGFGGMRVGGKRRLFIPYQLAYGADGRAPIPPKAELIFDIELVALSDTDPTPKPPAPPAAVPAPSAAPAPTTPPPTPPPSAAPTPAPATKPTQPQ